MPNRHSYEVTNIVTGQTIADQAGNVQVGNVVYYQTGLGNQASVFVEDVRFNEDNVKAKIRPAVKRLDRISQLAEEFD